jgi:phosphoribosylformylglycinamidine cyclo-ligase
LGEELLEPTRLYAREVLGLAAELGDDLHVIAHVTGGGLAANLARVLPPPLGAVVSRASWPAPPVFHWLHDAAHLAWEDMEGTLNLGVGMALVVSESCSQTTLELLAAAGEEAYVIGRVGSMAAVREEAAQRSGKGSGLVIGSKGVAGGAVAMIDSYRD